MIISGQVIDLFPLGLASPADQIYRHLLKSCWKLKISGPTSQGNQTLHFIEIFSNSYACESGTNMSPGDSYFSFILGWKWLKPVTLHKTLGSSTVKFSVTEVESGFLFLKCFKDGSIILRDPKKCSRFT